MLISFYPFHPDHHGHFGHLVTLVTQSLLQDRMHYCFKIHLCQLREYNSKDPINLAGHIHFISHKVAEISSRAQLDLAQMITLGTV